MFGAQAVIVGFFNYYNLVSVTISILFLLQLFNISYSFSLSLFVKVFTISYPYLNNLHPKHKLL